MIIASGILIDATDPSKGYQHVGPQLAQNLLSVCKYLSYPGKLLRLYSSSQLSFLLENEVLETPLGIRQKPEPDYRMRCFSPDNFDATSIQPCTKCESEVEF